MAANGRSGTASPFDDMLDESKREMERLYASRVPAGAEMAAPRPAAPRPAFRPPAAPPSARPASIDATRLLNDRYGGRWHSEVLEQRREGNTMVVRCRLVLDDHNIAKSAFGRAWIDRPRESRQIAGSADGVAFNFTKATPDPAADSAAAEDAAASKAVEAALASCVRQLDGGA